MNSGQELISESDKFELKSYQKSIPELVNAT